MQPRQIARELAVLSLSQMPANPEKLATKQLSDMLLAVVRTLSDEAQELLETASSELKQSSDRITESENRAPTFEKGKVLLNEAMETTQNAINRVGMALKIPEFIYLSNQQEVKSYALEIIGTANARKKDLEQLLNDVMEDWQLSRFPRIDRDILRVAATEMLYLGLPDKVAINEAIEIAKRYCSEDGYKLINGVLRKLSNHIKANAL
jgi:transcription antitermination protein NusB